MITVKKLSLVIAGAMLSAFCAGLEAAYAHLGHSPSEPHEEEHFRYKYKVSPPNQELSVYPNGCIRPGHQDVLVVPPDAPGRPAYYATGNLYTFLATGEETGGAFSLFDFVVPSQSGALPHIHSQEDEAFYVLEGEMTFQLGSPTGIQTIVAPPRTLVFLPKGRPHGWQNSGTTPAKMLSLVIPSGFEGFFIDQNQPVINESDPIPPPLPPELLAPIAQEYGVRPASPSDFTESNITEGLLNYLVVPPDTNRPSFNAAAGLFTFLATSEETGRQFLLLDVSLLPQSGLLRLLQNNKQEAHAFYVLEGKVKFQIGNRTMDAAPGTLIYFPKGTAYAFQNLGTRPARMLSLFIPTPVPKRSASISFTGDQTRTTAEQSSESTFVLRPRQVK